MARVDVRVKWEMPAHISYRAFGKEVRRSVIIEDIGLGGAWVHGFEGGPGEVLLSPDRPHGEIAFRSRVVRTGGDGAALRFVLPDPPVFSALWGQIRHRLPRTKECPYCSAPVQEGEYCGVCGGYLRFDADYLEHHLKNTLPQRIQSRSEDLDFPRMLKILALLDESSPAVRVEGEDFGMPDGLRGLVRQMATEDANLLIAGGDPKERALVAQRVHELGGRRQGTFLALDSSVDSESLKVTLFGHHRGGCQGAERTVAGALEKLAGGTLFVDNLPLSSLGLQARLLSFFETGIVEPLGGRGGRRIECRILLGVHADMRPQPGAFMKHVLDVLRAVCFQLPPLDKRSSDRLWWAEHFLAGLNIGSESSPPGFSADAIEFIRSGEWAGGLGSLEVMIAKGADRAVGGKITAAHLKGPAIAPPVQGKTYKELMERTEKELVLATLLKNGFNISRTAREMRISRPCLYSLMRRYGISNPP